MKLHTGGFVGGSSSESNYHPGELLDRAIDLEQPFVFTSIKSVAMLGPDPRSLADDHPAHHFTSYRLGALGLTASPPEPMEKPKPFHIPVRPPAELDLNVAFKDQLIALEWIHNHIELFGGDPEKVVLVGHSAGAMSVGLHQLYSGDRNLFRGGASRAFVPLVSSARC